MALPDSANAPIISPAIQDILVESFKDWLAFGPPSYGDGNSKMFRRDAETTLAAARAAFQAGGLTHSHLLLAAVFDALSQSDLTELRVRLVGVASLTVDWIESLDARGVE